MAFAGYNGVILTSLYLLLRLLGTDLAANLWLKQLKQDWIGQELGYGLNRAILRIRTQPTTTFTAPRERHIRASRTRGLLF